MVQCEYTHGIFAHEVVGGFFSIKRSDILEENKLLLQKPDAAAELKPFTHLQHGAC